MDSTRISIDPNRLAWEDIPHPASATSFVIQKAKSAAGAYAIGKCVRSKRFFVTLNLYRIGDAPTREEARFLAQKHFERMAVEL